MKILLNNKYNLKEAIFACLAFTILAIGYFVLLSNLNKGFDITDEGYYIQSLQDNQITIENYGMGIVKKLLFGYHELISVRIIRIVLNLIIVTIAYIVFKKEVQSKIILSLLLFAGLLHSYTFGPQSISYNSISAFFYAVPFLLMYASRKRYDLLSLLIAGIFSGIGFLIKPPSGLLSILMILILIYFSTGKAISKHSVIYLLVLILSVLTYLLINRTLDDYLIMIFTKFKTASNASWDVSRSHSFYQIILKLMKFIFNVILLSSFIFGFKKAAKYFFKENWRNKCSNILFIVSSMLAALILIYFESYRYYFSYYIIFIIISYITVDPDQRIHSRDIPFYILLFLFPAACSFGSNNPTIIAAVFHSLFWFLIIAKTMNVYKLGSIIRSSILVFLVVMNFILSYQFYPYRINNLSECNYLINDKGIYVDSELGKLYEELREEINPGNLILPIDNLPGLVYLLDGVYPGEKVWLWRYFFDNHYSVTSKTKIDRSYVLLFNETRKELFESSVKAGSVFEDRKLIISSEFRGGILECFSPVLKKNEIE
ncbi:MAG: glycosyltransferase family 39 protein [Saprospiraceae bacterium]|nr:glycosyltransferase family 39 protein [Saprospiraceae bacterium]